jgi:hypothetical protein
MSLLMRLVWSLLLLAGCGSATLARSSPSTVSRAQLYRTGDPIYDQFFLDLYAQQTEASSASEREQALRAELGRRTESRELTPEALAAKVADRLGELAARGTHLERDVEWDEADEDAMVELSVTGTPSDADRPLLQAVEAAVRGELAVVAEMTRRRRQVEQLDLLAQALERTTDRAFGQITLAKMPEIAQNLEDSRIVIVGLKARSETVRTAARSMLKQLLSAAQAAASRFPEKPPPPLVTEPDPKNPKASEPRSRAPGSAPKPGVPRASKPAPPPRDFEP